ncbi:ABC transporter permease [Mycobacterium sp. NAZ190054]|uniref:ABC transporter permease n=1 Tax=Mycobacterium sp. NAZ190054 TaxID=1747766 RepID=UPI00079C0F7C|nr:ABC transporter permease [Mycobacterium sp. NAZ190054]KWX67212.1 hypothetical protein ASJ79_22520 [Mycobacterium sp. NAZ190054]
MTTKAQTSEAAGDEAAQLLDAADRLESRRDRNGRVLVTLTSIGLFVAVVGVWEFAVRSGLVHSIVLAPPSDIALAMAEMYVQSYFWDNLWFTTRALLVSFLTGSAIGLALGLLLGASSFFRRVLSPYIIAFQALPKVALAPIMVTAFGFGIESKIVMGVVICFFPVFLDTMTGLLMVSEKRLILMRSFGATRLQTLWTVSIPSALPNIFAGLKAAVTMALVGVVIGELVGSRKGVGYLVQLNSFQLNIPVVYATIITLGLIGWFSYAIIDLLDHKLVFWRDSGA